jgi:hypothetical protein
MGFTKQGLLGVKKVNYTLVVTNLRLIFAMQTAQMLQEQAKNAQQEAARQGKNWLKQIGAGMGAWNGRHYLEMQPNAILAEQAGNYCLMRDQIRSVKIHIDHLTEEGQPEHHLEFITPTGKIKILFNALDKNQVKQLLTQALGNVVR